MSHQRGASIVGVGSTEIVRRTEKTLLSVTLSAAIAALQDADVDITAVDGLITSGAPPNPSARLVEGVDQVTAFHLAEAMGLKKLRVLMDTQVMCGSMLAAAIYAIASGACECVLLVKGMYNDTRSRYSEVTTEFAEGAAQFTLPYGFGPGGARFALWLKRYMYEHGASREDLYQIVRIARTHAAANEIAYWRNKDVSLEEYLTSRWICEPLSILDCDLPVTGAGALLVVSEAVARRLQKPVARILGCGMQDSVDEIFYKTAVTRQELKSCQLYDGFSCMVLYWLEHLGICKRGMGYKWLRDGRGLLGSDLPINTFGGSLGEGRLHGMGHLREAALQAMGRAGKRQVMGAGVGLVQVGIPESSWIFLLGSS